MSQVTFPVMLLAVGQGLVLGWNKQEKKREQQQGSFCGEKANEKAKKTMRDVVTKDLQCSVFASCRAVKTRT